MRKEVLFQGEPRLPNFRDRFEALRLVHELALKARRIMSPMGWTAIRGPLALGTLGVAPFSPGIAAGLYGFNALLDYVDGLVARACQETSLEGATLDPLMDKLVNDSTLIYLLASSSNPAFLLAALANIGLDFYSQNQRGPIREQLHLLLKTLGKDAELTYKNDPAIQANWPGKIKTALQSLAIVSMLWDPNLAAYSAGVLGGAAASDYIGTQQRRKIVLPKLTAIPRISLQGSPEILLSPEAFREELLASIAKAEKRIYLAALYITPDEAGWEIVDALVKAKQERPDLEIKVLIDFHRNQRGRIGEKNAETGVDLFRTANDKLPTDQQIDFLGVPVASKERAGVFHTKGIVIDDTLFYSGASLNNVYLKKQGEYRLDRYFVFRDEQPLADVVADYLQTISEQEAVRKLDQVKVPVDPNLKKQIGALRKHFQEFKQGNVSESAQSNAMQVLFLAGLEQGNVVSETILNLVAAAEKDVTLYTPYFNPAKKLRASIRSALARSVTVNLVIGDKTANDFYRDPNEINNTGLSPMERGKLALADALPYIYEQNLRKFISEFHEEIKSGLLNVFIWKDGKNTFHAKGVDVDNGTAILMTGHNQNNRSDRRDAETGLLILNADPDTQSNLQAEKTAILANTKKITAAEDLPTALVYPGLVRAICALAPKGSI